MLARLSDWSDLLHEELTEYCEENKDKVTCCYVDASHDVFDGVKKFMSIESENESVLAFLDYRIKNGWKVPNPTTFTSNFWDI